jgi:hypothetical protein
LVVFQLMVSFCATYWTVRLATSSSGYAIDIKIALPIAPELLLVAFVVFVVGVIVFVAAILFFIHMLHILLCLVFGPADSLISAILNKNTWKKNRTRQKRRHIPFTIPVVSTLGLGQLINFGPGKTDEQFLGEGVVDRLALLALVVLESLEGRKGNTAGDRFVGQFGLMLLAIVVNPLVGFMRLIYRGKSLVDRNEVWWEKLRNGGEQRMGAGHTPTVRHDGLIEVGKKGRNWLETMKAKSFRSACVGGRVVGAVGIKYVLAGATPFSLCP